MADDTTEPTTTGEEVDDDMLLATPLDETDLDARLEAAGDRRRARSTTVLATIALVVVGFALGAIVTSSLTSMTAAMEAASQDPVAHPEVTGPQVLGTVRAVDGDVLLVDQADGSILRVVTSASTRVAASRPVSIDTVDPGMRVVITGSFDDEGRLDATVVQQFAGR